MTTIKERPIPFNGEMVRAILVGKKTQTRRVIKPQPLGLFAGETGQQVEWLEWERRYAWHDEGGELSAYRKSPHGKPGDRLWVKETWRIGSLLYDDAPIIQYKADGVEREGDPIDGPGAWDDDKYLEWCRRQWEHMATDCAKAGIEADTDGIFDWTAETNPNRWHPGRFMPCWASRILLEVTGVRVERVQEISERDALAEGIFKHCEIFGWTYTWNADMTPHFYGLPRWAFKALWNSIHSKRGLGWDTNPWVWVVEFKVLERSRP